MKNYYFLLIGIFATLSANGQLINFPDAGLKTALLNSSTSNSTALNENGIPISIDVNGDGEIEISEAEGVYVLFIPINLGITEVTGVENFQNVTSLSCTYNLLTSIDVSGMPNLKYLYLNDNSLTNIILNTSLESLFCGGNNLGQLNISGCLSLVNLSCIDNHLTDLDITGLNNLRHLSCWNNDLTSLIVTQSKLNDLICFNNLLTVLDLNGIAPESGGFALDCSQNLLSLLDLSVIAPATTTVMLSCENNPNLTFINARHGHLMYDVDATQPPGSHMYFNNCPALENICADSFNFSYLEEKIVQYGYNNCTVDSSCSLNVPEMGVANMLIYPNPVNTNLYFNISEDGAQMASIYNLLGQLIKSKVEIFKNELDVSNLSSGTYIIKIQSDSRNSVGRFIKQ